MKWGHMRHNEPEWSYARHYHHTSDLSEEELPSCYSRPDSIDAWRHERMQKTVVPLVKAYPKATWMTIGDGSYGSDAYFLRGIGADVLATNLNEERLKIAMKKGFIDKFKAENAEKISFPDNSFDFVLCKEAYHHFPRPPMAFYEMLRVVRRAVILIEPQETCKKKILGYAKDILKMILRRDKSTVFEPSGNHIFRVNIREIEKMMTSLNYEIVSIKGLNDFYHPRLSKAKLATLPFSITEFGIGLQNILCKLKMLDYGLATIIAFKQVPANELKIELRRNGFRILNLPRNPYIQGKDNIA